MSTAMDNSLDRSTLDDMDQLSAIRTFLRIVETGSVTKAAASLGMPKSTASKFLADLEAHLETRLLQRSTRSVTLTAEGAEYYEQVSQIVLRLGDADLAIRDKSSSPRGRLRIDVHSSMANIILIPALAEFRTLYPGIELAIGVSDRPVNLIEEAVDCVIRLGPIADTTLISRTLYEDRLITCAAPRYLAQNGIPASPAELSGRHETIGYFSARTGERWPLRFEKDGNVSELIEMPVMSNDSASYLTMLLSGLGIGQVFQSTAQKYLDDGTLIAVLPDWTNMRAPIIVLYPPTKRLNARVRVFIDWLSAMLEKRSPTR